MDWMLIASADPGEIVTFRIRNASDVELGPGRLLARNHDTEPS